MNVTQFDLEHGLHVILKEDHFSPVVAFQMWVKVGSVDESPDEAGLAHVMEHMLFKGTERRGVGEIARDVESAGGDINAWTSFEETVFHLVLPSSEFERGLDILSDAVQHSAMETGELARELEVIREEIKRGKDSPSTRLSEELFRLSFSQHPYRNPVIGTDESLKTFTRDKVVAFFRKWYVPGNMTLILAGDFNTDEARQKIPGFFGDFRSSHTIRHSSFSEAEQTGSRARVFREDVRQVHLAWSFPALCFDDPDLPALDVLGVLLGQGESSRLIQLLQRRHAWVNDICAYPYAGVTAGLFLAEATLPTKHVEDVVHAAGREFFRPVVEAVREKELEKAKTIVENEAVYQMQTMQGKASRLGHSYVMAGDTGFLDRHLDRVRRLKASDLQSAARRILSPERINLVLLWPREDAGSPPPESLIEWVEQASGEFDRSAESAFSPDENGIFRSVLPNGVRLLVKENRAVPLVSFQAAVLAGLRFEDESNNGVNNLIARMLTLGTQSMTAAEIAEEVDGMAGSLDGFSGRNSLGMRATVISRHFERGFDLFAKCLLEPAFDAGELQKEKTLVLEEIRARDEVPARVAFDLFHRTLYQRHPFRMDMLGTNDTVGGMSRDILKTYYRRLFSPDGLVLSIVGDVSASLVMREAERLFGHLEPVEAALYSPEPEPKLETTRRANQELEKHQTYLVLGFFGLDFKDEDRYALEVTNALFSGQGGRLFLELRDRRSLAYAVSSYHLESLDPGYWVFFIATSPQKRREALDGMLNELRRLLDGGPEDGEIEKVKCYLIGSQAISLQTNSAVSGSMLLDELYGIGYDAHTRYAERISAVTTGQVRRVAARLLTLDAYALAEVGPGGD